MIDIDVVALARQTRSDGLPSELLEGPLEAACSMCIRELRDSDGGDAAWANFVEQITGIDRVATCASGRRHGSHASMASGSMAYMARQASRWPREDRDALLRELSDQLSSPR